jgi:WD40 repeat protein
LSTADGLPSLAANRGTEPAKLTRLVRGELDWIVMKALEKDRNRRYETANGLALDVQRYLADEPVLACPPSAWYRWRKLARRHKAALTAAAGVSAALAVAVAVLAVSLVLVRQEQEATERAKGEREQDYRGRIAALEGETKALAGETRALQREKRALENWRQTSYFLVPTLAFKEYEAGNVTRAEELLQECPEDLRRWEWHYLKRLCAIGLANNLVFRKEIPAFGEDEIIDRVPACSADGRYLAVTAVPPGQPSAKGSVRQRRLYWVKVREGATGKLVATLRAENAWDRLASVALSPDGRYAAAMDCHCQLFVWDVASGKRLIDIVAHVLPPVAECDSTSISFNHDGTRLATACPIDTAIKVWEVATGKEVGKWDPGTGLSSMAWSPKGTWVAAATPQGSRERGGFVHVWDATTGKARHILRGDTTQVMCLAFSPDERLLATGGIDKRVRLWDVETGLEVATYRGHSSLIMAVSFSGDGKRLRSLDNRFNLKLWDATRPPEFLTLHYRGSSIEPIVFSPDSRHVAGVVNTGGRGPMVVWDAASGAEVARISAGNPKPEVVAFSPDGRLLAADTPGLGFLVTKVGLWDWKSGKLHRSLPANGEGVIGTCYCLASSPVGQLLAAGGVERVIHVWDLETGAKKWRLAGHKRTVGSLAFSRDGRRLVSASGGRWITLGPIPPGFDNPLHLQGDDPSAPDELKVWDRATGTAIFSLELPPSPGGFPELQALAISPKGDVIAIGARSGMVRLYDVATRQQVAVLSGQKVFGVAFSPDGLRIVTGGESLRLWEAKTGRAILTLGHHPPGIHSVAFSPDGWKILTSNNRDVRIWDATPLKR